MGHDKRKEIEREWGSINAITIDIPAIVSVVYVTDRCWYHGCLCMLSCSRILPIYNRTPPESGLFWWNMQGSRFYVLRVPVKLIRYRDRIAGWETLEEIFDI